MVARDVGHVAHSAINRIVLQYDRCLNDAPYCVFVTSNIADVKWNLLCQMCSKGLPTNERVCGKKARQWGLREDGGGGGLTLAL